MPKEQKTISQLFMPELLRTDVLPKSFVRIQLYGKDCNVMGEVLLSRYELFCLPERSPRVKTHTVVNLNAQDLEECYGKRMGFCSNG